MGVLSKKLFLKYTRWADKLLLISTIFTCTYFIYRDFGVRMILGYAVLGICVLIHAFRRLLLRKSLRFECWKIPFIIMVIFIIFSLMRPSSYIDYDIFSYLIAMVLCTVLLFLWEPNKEEAQYAKKALLVGGFFISCFVVFFNLFPNLFWNSIYNFMTPLAQDYLSKYVPKGYGITLGEITYTDYIIFSAYSVSISQIIIDKNHKNRIGYLALSVLFAFSVFLTGRRSELIALVGASLILLVLMGKSKRQILNWSLLIFGGITLIIILIVLFYSQLKNIDVFYRYAMTIENLLNGNDISSGRLELYSLAISAFISSPIVGIGWSAFSQIIPESFQAIHGGNVRNVHCIYLQFLCETGIIGFLIIVPVLFFFIYHAIRLFRLTLMSQKSNKTSFCFSMISLLIQLFLLLIGFIDPCFTKLIFWNFYSIAIMFLGIAAYVEKYEFLNHDSKLLLVKNQFAKLMEKLKMIHK